MAAKNHAARAKLEWEERARSPFRDFYVASHRGWNDVSAWRAQALADASIVTARTGRDLPGAIGKTPFKDLDVLEIGCGVGRLASILAPRFRSYTGIDHAPSMIAEARVGAPRNARYFTSDGTTIPEAARDRRYGLVFAHAVFIHCAAETCAALVAAARGVLAPEGQLRAQFLADPNEAIAPFSTTIELPGAEIAAAASATEEGAGGEIVSPEALRLIDGTAYKGAVFRAAETASLLAKAGFTRPDFFRSAADLRYVLARP